MILEERNRRDRSLNPQTNSTYDFSHAVIPLIGSAGSGSSLHEVGHRYTDTLLLEPEQAADPRRLLVNDHGHGQGISWSIWLVECTEHRLVLTSEDSMSPFVMLSEATGACTASYAFEVRASTRIS